MSLAIKWGCTWKNESPHLCVQEDVRKHGVVFYLVCWWYSTYWEWCRVNVINQDLIIYLVLNERFGYPFKTTRIRKLCCFKPSTLTILLLSKWCRTLRRVCYPLDMEYLFLTINILRHMRKNVWRQYPMPQLWVALCIRCYILDKIFAFVRRMVSRYQSNLGLEHWMVVKHMLKYLWRMRDYMLVYNHKSTFRLVFALDYRVVNWRSVKQSYIVDSTMEAKYVVASTIIKGIYLIGLESFS